MIMRVQDKHYRTIWLSKEDPQVLQIIDQRHLPHQFVVEDLTTVEHVAEAIRDMHVRGAGLIGATAGYGMYIAAVEASDTSSRSDFLKSVRSSGEELTATRPTAVNLAWAVHRQLRQLESADGEVEDLVQLAQKVATEIADEDAEFCRQIGQHGLPIIREISRRKGGQPVNVLTHCNAGWLAFVDYGSATAPIYAAHDEGIPVHVWVDETRPRNQGAGLTAWELSEHGVPHTIVVDNAGGYLMQQGMVDMVITGTDRTTYTGDVANKIGTYLKALAAYDNNLPFYVALPSSTFDWEMEDGVEEIPIEQRDPDEVRLVSGVRLDGQWDSVLISPQESPAANFAFDVTPSRLVTGLITERGLCSASKEGVLALYPEKRTPAG
jgi:methylthioribose-1-phosphate isomerase